jgi:hypothetical protein
MLIAGQEAVLVGITLGEAAGKPCVVRGLHRRDASIAVRIELCERQG